MFLIEFLLRQLPRLAALPPGGALSAGADPGAARRCGLLTTVDKVAMGPVPVGSATRCRIGVANAGDAPLVISKAVVLGVDSREFTHTTDCLGVLMPGERREVEICLVPRSPGLKSSLLTLVHDGADGGLKSVLLYGHGTSD